jgi:hypothetical protein
LHFCSQEYLPHFGGSDSRVVIVKINPRDVVSIPTDYNNAKGRACRYEVIGEVGANPDDATEFDKPVQRNANSVKTEPKSGSTAFYKGYTDGFTCQDYDTGDYWTATDQTNYEEGYEKGQFHSEEGMRERYRYVGTPAGTVFTAQDGAWPFPNK